MATITLHGTPFKTCGDLPAVGTLAPDFVLVNNAMENVSLAQFTGKKKLLNIVPSLDTPICATSTQKFNAKSLENAVMLVISADLPFAQKRFCAEASIDKIIPLSMMRSRAFAKQYGVLIEDGPLAGITARAVVVLDENNQVIYTQLVSEIAQEPDYDQALAALSR